MPLTNKFTIAVVALILTTVPSAGSSFESGVTVAEQGGASSPELLRRIVSRQQLTPPLRGPALQVRFSPDGAHILIQDEAGIYVLARQPLGLTLTIAAPKALAARFSADSQTLIVATESLNVARYDLAMSWKISETPPLAAPACLAAELSPDGELAACYDTALRLRILRASTGEQLFSDQFRAPLPERVAIPVPRGREAAFAEPFGYLYAGMSAWSGRRDYAFSMAFSPDGRFLLAHDANNTAMAVDVPSRKRLDTPRFLIKNPETSCSFVDADRALVLESKKGRESELFAMPDGRPAGRLRVSGAAAVEMSERRYLRVAFQDAQAPAVFDLQTNGFVENLRTGATDILGDTAVTYSSDGEVNVYNVGENQSLGRYVLPVNLLPELRTVSASPGLESLAISIHGAAALYRIATGERVASHPQMNGAWFSTEDFVYLRSRRSNNVRASIQKSDLKSGKTAHAWSELETPPIDGISEDPHPGGAVLFVDTPAVFTPRYGDVGLQMKSTQAYTLRALDMERGTRLWERIFRLDVPVPFADPQGERMVLGWIATTGAARAEAGRVVRGTPAAKRTDRSGHDTFFEVLDARTGKILGGVTVQIGAGPEDFESVFSVGDALILVKDAVRITVVSLSSGLEVGRFFGSVLAASRESNLLAASDRNHLKLYDLKTGAKKEEFVLPEQMAYLHFSADGKRLLAVTGHQMAYVLDLAGASIPVPAVQP
jgi:WD40 repeat protein